MVRQVRGPGTLVPEQIRWVSAVTAGRVLVDEGRPGHEFFLILEGTATVKRGV